MKYKLTERDLSRIVKRVINEGVYSPGDLINFPDGTYLMTKMEPTDQPSQNGNYFVKNGNSISNIVIVSGQVKKKEDGSTSPYGSGILYKGK